MLLSSVMALGVWVNKVELKSFSLFSIQGRSDSSESCLLWSEDVSDAAAARPPRLLGLLL